MARNIAARNQESTREQAEGAYVKGAENVGLTPMNTWQDFAIRFICVSVETYYWPLYVL